MVLRSSPGSPPSPPYNMGLAWDAQKLNPHRSPRYRAANPDLPIIGLQVDKLRLGFYSSTPCTDFAASVVALVSSRLGQGPRRGNMRPLQFRGWTKPHRVEGGVYWQADQQLSMPSGSSYVVCEFNPQKLDGDQWQALRDSLAALGVTDVRSVFVERYDAAFDYCSPRHNVILDDRRRLVDMFGVGRKGPQTERTGFRKGSPLKAQLYDKTRERRDKGVDGRDNVSRFELMVIKPGPADDSPAPLYGFKPSDALVLGDLGRVGYPGGDITVRAIAYHPLRVANHAFGSLTAYARGLGLRAALGYAVDVFQLKSSQRQQWLDTFLPQLVHSPPDVFRSSWPSAVDSVLHRLGVTC